MNNTTSDPTREPLPIDTLEDRTAALADQNGARSAHEANAGGSGLDEAGRARPAPLDGKPELDLLEEDDSVLDDAELASDAPLDCGRDRDPGAPRKR